MPEAWSDSDNDLTVAAYFELFRYQLLGEPVVKAEVYRKVSDLIGRSAKSVEFKFQNISAVLLGLGERRAEGLAPAANFQASLVDAVVRWLEDNSEWLLPGRGMEATAVHRQMSEEASLYIGPPPHVRNTPPSSDEEKLVAVAHQFDVAGRDERNTRLGVAGEKLAFENEKRSLRQAGRSDLADAVRWTSQVEGDGAGFDIESFESDGRPRLIEVKTTNGFERTPFFISENERRFAERNRETWLLLRLYDFDAAPRAFELRPPLERHVTLTATSWRGDFN